MGGSLFSELKRPFTQPLGELPAAPLQASGARRRHDLLPKRATNASLPPSLFPSRPLVPSFPRPPLRLSSLRPSVRPSITSLEKMHFLITASCAVPAIKSLPSFPTPPLSAPVRIQSRFPRGFARGKVPTQRVILMSFSGLVLHRVATRRGEARIGPT